MVLGGGTVVVGTATVVVGGTVGVGATVVVGGTVVVGATVVVVVGAVATASTGRPRAWFSATCAARVAGPYQPSASTPRTCWRTAASVLRPHAYEAVNTATSSTGATVVVVVVVVVGTVVVAASVVATGATEVVVEAVSTDDVCEASTGDATSTATDATRVTGEAETGYRIRRFGHARGEHHHHSDDAERHHGIEHPTNHGVQPLIAEPEFRGTRRGV